MYLSIFKRPGLLRGLKGLNLIEGDVIGVAPPLYITRNTSLVRGDPDVPDYLLAGA